MLKWFSRVVKRAQQTDGLAPAPVNPTVAGTGPVDSVNAEQSLIRQGNAMLDQGRLGEAASLYRAALAREAGNVDARVNLGFVLREMGQLVEAARELEAVLRMMPTQKDALFLLGLKAQAEGQAQRAVDLLRRCLEAHPDFEPAVAPLCSLLQAEGRLEEAAALVRKSLDLMPVSPDLWCLFAKLQSSLGQHGQALQSCDHALSLNPEHDGAWSDRGLVLNMLRRHEEAVASLQKALSRNPASAEAHSNMGVVLTSLKEYESALAHIDQSLVLKPNFPQALHNRGQALTLLKRYQEAASTYRRLLSIAPDHEQAVGNLLWSQIYTCNWDGYEKLRDSVLEAVSQGALAMEPWSFIALSDSAASQLKCASTYAAARFPPARMPVWNGERYKHDRIRVAYLSADLHEHATAYLMAELFERHDRRLFSTVAISFGPNSASPMRERLVRAFETFVDVSGRSDLEIASLVRDMEIDIAVDLKGYTTDARPGILAHRAAPVQVNYLGYPGTLGAPYIDYLVADAWTVPPDHEIHYTEKIVRLPGSYQVNDSRRTIGAQAPTRANAGLPEDGFVYCCFNNNYKITPQVFSTWMNILRSVKGSVLWLIADNDAAVTNLRREAESRGIQGDRLVFARRIPLPDHLARHKLADLFLDTTPCNAHTTASDALWAGLPVLTMLGTTFAGRVGASLLHAVELETLVVHSLADYEQRAIRLAADKVALHAIRTHLEEQRGRLPLFDCVRFTKQLESAFRIMWTRHQDDQKPASFLVPQIAP